MDVKTALSELENQDYFVWDDFLSADEVTDVLVDYKTLLDASAFQFAGTGNASVSSNLNQQIRSDQTYWLESLALSPPQILFWKKLDALKMKINERFFLGLWDLQGHYSHYPVDAYYRQHYDRFGSDDRRVISMVIYLNPNWVKDDGGELRIHIRSSGSTTTLVDVAPIAGRLICFLSEKVSHEVLVTHQVRMSFAGWWTRN